MAAKIDENTQFVDSDGKPLVNGKIYIGTQNLDPKLNAITIYSDRELTVALANPQTLDAQGRPASKIWIPGKYSFRVDDLNAIQKIQDLDAGSVADTGTTTLSNVQGINTITAEASPTVTAYVDGEIYSFKAAALNTGAVTLNIDGVGAKSIKKNHNQEIAAGEFEANQYVKCTYNSTDATFEWTNYNLKTMHWTKGADIASAVSITIPNDGNFHDITGNTGPIATINNIISTPQIIQTDSTPTFTHHATNLICPGGVDYVARAGEVLFWWPTGAATGILIPFFNPVNQAEQEAATLQGKGVTPATQHHHPSAAKAWAVWANGGTVNNSFNVASVTDNAVGNFTVNWDTDFSSTNYVALPSAVMGGAAADAIMQSPHNAGNAKFTTFDGNNVAGDGSLNFIAAYGDQ